MCDDNLDQFLDQVQSDLDDEAASKYGLEMVARWKNPTYMSLDPQTMARGSSVGSCGDTIDIYLDVEDGRISKAFFYTDGCGPSIVCGETAARLAHGKTVDEAATIEGEDIMADFGGLPEEKTHCAFLAATALKEALGDYYRKYTDKG